MLRTNRRAKETHEQDRAAKVDALFNPVTLLRTKLAFAFLHLAPDTGQPKPNDMAVRDPVLLERRSDKLRNLTVAFL